MPDYFGMAFFRRIVDAVRTLLRGSPPTQAEARFRSLESEARALIMEMNDTLEKLNTWAAREAKRRARATRADLEPGKALPTEPPPAAEPVLGASLRTRNRGAWKASILARHQAKPEQQEESA